MKLTNGFIRLRAPEPTDLDAIYLLEAEEGVQQGGMNMAPVSRQQIYEYIKSYNADFFSARELRMCIELCESGETVGTVDISDYSPRDRRGFIGIAIREDYRNKGIGSAALKILCDYAFSELGMHHLAAMVMVDNEPSKKLFESSGFKTCGRLRSWVRRGRQFTDVLMYQLLFP